MSNGRTAAMSAGVAAVLFSLIAVSVRAAARQADPLMLNACIQAGLAAVAFAYTAGAWRRLPATGGGSAIAAAVGAAGRRRTVVAAGMLVVGSWDYTLYSASVQIADAAVAAATRQLWVPTLIVVLACTTRRLGRQLDAGTAAMVAVAVIGAGLAAWSQRMPSAACAHSCLLGGTFGAAAGILSGLFAAGCLWFADAAAASVPADKRRAAMLVWSHAALGVGAASGVVTSVAAAVAVNGTRLPLEAAVGGIAIGAALVGVGSWALRIAHAHSTNLGIHAVCGLSPAAALVWLALDGIAVQQLTMFAAGAAVAIIANIVIQVRAGR